ncbi:hypothetical protein AM588_10005044 [Phytophthora nicotianae]|uniref:tRNA:m(4)X modification enzyme TRM13 n=1 Tax=Phytophthora nicotianae TaxID=4792 RepID=A0A0W8CZH9_PHYNI|nr:hypothetical protein AM588_10005044 [Phytophthora nicotianae]
METKRSAEQLSRDASASAASKSRLRPRTVASGTAVCSGWCGKTATATSPVVSKKSQKFKAATRRRVPCPVDASHTVYEYDLAKHVKDDRAVLGRKCKRIIDAGRAAYLAQLQLKTRLVHYCDTKDSLENCLLVAWR